MRKFVKLGVCITLSILLVVFCSLSVFGASGSIDSGYVELRYMTYDPVTGRYEFTYGYGGEMPGWITIDLSEVTAVLNQLINSNDLNTSYILTSIGLSREELMHINNSLSAIASLISSADSNNVQGQSAIAGAIASFQSIYFNNMQVIFRNWSRILNSFNSLITSIQSENHDAGFFHFRMTPLPNYGSGVESSSDFMNPDNYYISCPTIPGCNLGFSYHWSSHPEFGATLVPPQQLYCYFTVSSDRPLKDIKFKFVADSCISWAPTYYRNNSDNFTRTLLDMSTIGFSANDDNCYQVSFYTYLSSLSVSSCSLTIYIDSYHLAGSDFSEPSNKSDVEDYESAESQLSSSTNNASAQSITSDVVGTRTSSVFSGGTLSALQGLVHMVNDITDIKTPKIGTIVYFALGIAIIPLVVGLSINGLRASDRRKSRERKKK